VQRAKVSPAAPEAATAAIIDEKVKRVADFFNGQIIDVELNNESSSSPQ